MDKKKLVLVNPPYCLPTSPPLGICWLKGFVERELPDWSAKSTRPEPGHPSIPVSFAGRADVLVRAEPPEGHLGDIALSRAAEVFRGEHGDEFYNRPTATRSTSISGSVSYPRR